MIILKTPDEIAIMDEANRILHSILDRIEPQIQPGQNTQTLDDIAVECCIEAKVRPAFKGYKGYLASLCVSVNEAIVHQIPSPLTILKEGDVVSVDFGVEYKGFYADAARTVIIGHTTDRISHLVANTRAALWAGIEQMKVGNRLQDISRAIEDIARTNHYGNIRTLCGHGIGRALHQPPNLLNYTDHKAPNIRLQEGLVLAIEPMFTLGSSDVKVLGDGWTAVTADGSVAVHWELSVAVVNGKAKVLGC